MESFILVLSFCATFEGGDMCGAAVIQQFYPTRKTCEADIEIAMLGNVAEADRKGGVVYFLDGRCEQVKGIDA